MIDAFMEYLLAERGLSELTLRNYRRDVERFFAWLQECGMSTEPHDITAGDIREWILARSGNKGQKIGAGSVNRELSSLKAFFGWLRKRGLVDRDITHNIKRLKQPKRLPAFVPESRMRTIVERCAEPEHQLFTVQRDALMILMLYTCGLRLAELVGIDRQDFSSDFRSLKVRGKGNKERVVPILEDVRVKILAHISLIEGQNICNLEEKALFLTLKGRRISRSVVQRAVKRALTEGEVQGRKSPHVLRHTFATHLMNSGADIREIEELLGHTSLKATQVYTHNSIARLREVYRNAHPREKDGE